ncbi:cellulose synthase-like protein G3 [Macadamia integrifolia]|uniref:cellulose synthase-like protein G3 n=1 Tax=Macadamia integrifolia TaxID=60698 RepID=UPI001C4E5D36|nr:cellulose synthase-like protein G3 [Macadamia integrifolia]
MESSSKMMNTTISPPLHTLKPLRRTWLNRAFALVYTCAIVALFYHHSLTLLHSTSFTTFFLSLIFLLTDAIFVFMWVNNQSYRMRPVRRREFPENLLRFMKERDFPAVDIFICTADPYKEPPINVVNTALSVMAYDYPMEKLSVYVSDDGGSELTLFAFMEAAKFATHWLPFCKEQRIEERCPNAYFKSTHRCTETQKMKTMYETMKAKVESAMDRGRVPDEYIANVVERDVFDKWTAGFTRDDHPAVIQVLVENGREKDMRGHEMPNLVYVSREKSKACPHHFKAGALNALLRVSAAMTNAPVLLTLDCDMYSNDPKTPLRVLCYLSDPTLGSKLAFVQFPQHFHGINKHDIYAGEMKRLFQINPQGMDGLAGANYVGTGCFFQRRAFFGPQSSLLSPEIQELNPDHVVNKPVRSEAVLTLAHHVASCNYENQTNWGIKMGFRYGSLVEDYYTGYRLHCEGWKSVFCNPERAAFLGDAPINLSDVLGQIKRWSVGLLEVAFSKYSPVTFGIQSMGILMGLSYAHLAFWPIWSFPVAFYAFVPQLALINRVFIFPEVSDPWFYLYIFLFLGAYAQDLLEFLLARGTILMWWNNQRMWMIRGISSYLLGSIDFFLKSIGISAFGFNVTSKVIDDEQSKRYEQGIFEFGVASPLFVPLTTAAIINLISLLKGIADLFKDGNIGEVFVQLFLSSFVVINCWPIYEAIALRKDGGKMPTKTTVASTLLAWVLYSMASLISKP